MTWWSRLVHELRSIVVGPYPTGDPALARVFGSGPTSSGESVTPEKATGLATVWRCVSLIAGTVGQLPCTLYRRTEDGGREKYVTHPLYGVLHDRPSPYMSAMTFFEGLTTAVLLYGNGYAAVTKDDDNRTRALWFIHPDRVVPEPTKTGRMRYRVTNPDGSQTLITDMVHVVGPLSSDGVTGRSVITALREGIGAALATERYTGEFFANSATPKGVLTHPGRLSEPATKSLREALERAQVQKGRRHSSLILEEGMRWEALGINAEDAQLIETRRFSVEDIGRAFGVPLHLVGSPDKSTVYSNSAQDAMHFLKFGLSAWLRRIEAAIELACIPSLERNQMYVEFNVDALLSVSTMERYQAYEIGVRGGWLTVGEIRTKENMPSLTLPERVPTLE